MSPGLYTFFFLPPGVLLEKKTALDKRGLVGGSDYSNGPVGRTALLPKDPPPDRPAFGDNVGVVVSCQWPLCSVIYHTVTVHHTVL